MINRKAVILSMQLIVVFCFLPSLTQAEVTLAIGDGSGFPGSNENPVVVSLDNPNDKVKGVQVDVCDADDYLLSTGCETTERTTGFDCSANELDNGCYRLILLTLSEGSSITEGEGPILTLKYDVSGEAPAGECRDLNPEEVQVAGEMGEIQDVITEPGEFCFFTSSTTTTTIPSNGVSISIDLSPNKSHWIPLPYLMVIEGNGTHFKAFTSTLDFEPASAVLPFWPLVLSELYIWDIIWVMPIWLAGEKDQTVTVTVTTEDEVVKGDFKIIPLPFLFDQGRRSEHGLN